jgi:hypothetical protein
MNLDSITYGNPTKEQLPYLLKESYLDSLFSELTSFGFPKNSSDATKEELNHIVDCLNLIPSRESHLERYKIYDRHLKKYFIEGMVKGGVDAEEITKLVNDVIEDTLPLLTKLKYHFQRPRPYQLAQYYKLKLFPFKSNSADTPSFPSGHSFQAKLLTEVIGNKYPQTYSFMQDVFNDICYSRIYLGLHYQSDIDVGIFCAEKVLRTRSFMEKYKL